MLLQHHESVADFLLSIMFTEEHLLGWDPSITRLPPPMVSRLSAQYDITILDTSKDKPVKTTFRTKEMLWNYGADVLCGRGTRVWTAVKLDAEDREGTELFVVKDHWSDIGRHPEGKTVETIHNAVRTAGVPDDMLLFTEYFMQVEGYGDVHVNGKPDRTDGFKTDPKDKPAPAPEVLKVTVRSEEGSPTDVKLPRRGLPSFHRSAMQDDAVCYSAKIHRRTVFQSEGKSLLEVDSLYDVYRHILEVLVGKHFCSHHIRDVPQANANQDWMFCIA